MADWYCSSAAYLAVPAFQATHAYSVGDFIRCPAQAVGFLFRTYVYRCTTAGTSSSSEPLIDSNNGTSASGTATFTNVTGQATYGWNAAGGTLYAFTTAQSTRLALGDRIFISSDHNETAALGAAITGQLNFTFAPAGFGLVQVVSVSRTGSVPPVAANLAPGANITVTNNNLVFDCNHEVHFEGLTFAIAGTAAGSLLFANNVVKSLYFRNCALNLTSTNVGNTISTAQSQKVTLDNTTVQFGNISQSIAQGGRLELLWINTPAAVQGAIIPTALLNGSGNGAIMLVTCRGVDLSAVTTSLVKNLNAQTSMFKVLLDSCAIASGVTRFNYTSGNSQAADEVELVNCFDGANILSERHTTAGDLTIDRSTTMQGGAQDDIGLFSHKLVSSARTDKSVLALESFWLDVGNALTGVSRTATVEIISSVSLNNTDIQLLLEYQGAAASSLASFGSSLATTLTTATALPSSTVTWNNLPTTPVKQYLQVTFTPQIVGRVRGLVRLGKVSTTVWINPQVIIA